MLFPIDRLIIQTAVTEGIRSLFKVHDQPNNLDYAVNEILYGRTIIVSAIEDALGFNGSRSPVSKSEDDNTAPCSDKISSSWKQAWTKRHQSALDTLRAGIRTAKSSAKSVADAVVATGIVKSLHRFASDVQTSLKTTPLRQPPNPTSTTTTTTPITVSFDLQAELERSVLTVCSILGTAVVAVGRAMAEVAVVVTEPEPFSGLHFDEGFDFDAASIVDEGDSRNGQDNAVDSTASGVASAVDGIEACAATAAHCEEDPSLPTCSSYIPSPSSPVLQMEHGSNSPICTSAAVAPSSISTSCDVVFQLSCNANNLCKPEEEISPNFKKPDHQALDESE